MNYNKNSNPIITNDDELDKLSLFQKNSKMKLNNNLASKLIKDTNDIHDDLIKEIKQPANYGAHWSDDDKTKLIKLLHKNDNEEINYTEIATKLGRTEGGVKGEIKKMVITKYFNGIDAEKISTELNIQYKYIKMMIYSYLDEKIDEDIKKLEKENSLLKLKIENIKLRKNIIKLIKKDNDDS
jgi:hypothetical protein